MLKVVLVIAASGISALLVSSAVNWYYGKETAE